jgi:hypothetical protein
LNGSQRHALDIKIEFSINLNTSAGTVVMYVIGTELDKYLDIHEFMSSSYHLMTLQKISSYHIMILHKTNLLQGVYGYTLS